MKWIIHPNLAKTLLSGHHRKKIKKQPKHGVTSRSGRDSSSPQNVLVCSCGTFRMKYLMPSVKVYFIQQDGGGRFHYIHSLPCHSFLRRMLSISLHVSFKSQQGPPVWVSFITFSITLMNLFELLLSPKNEVHCCPSIFWGAWHSTKIFLFLTLFPQFTRHNVPTSVRRRWNGPWLAFLLRSSLFRWNCRQVTVITIHK